MAALPELVKNTRGDPRLLGSRISTDVLEHLSPIVGLKLATNTRWWAYNTKGSVLTEAWGVS